MNKRYRGMVKCLTPKMLAIASLSNCMYCFLVAVRVLLVNDEMVSTYMGFRLQDMMEWGQGS